jgi:hypothetical protein
MQFPAPRVFFEGASSRMKGKFWSLRLKAVIRWALSALRNGCAAYTVYSRELHHWQKPMALRNVAAGIPACRRAGHPCPSANSAISNSKWYYTVSSPELHHWQKQMALRNVAAGIPACRRAGHLARRE